jgi:putative DNA methylase
MVCRKRTTSEVGEYPTVRRQIEARVRQKLTQFWEEGIRGADFFMSAIGPAVEAFGKYARVEKLSGEPVTVEELLEYVRQGREPVRAGADPEADSPGERRCPHSVLCPLAVDI